MYILNKSIIKFLKICRIKYNEVIKYLKKINKKYIYICINFEHCMCVI